jgi:hypothetical protein
MMLETRLISVVSGRRGFINTKSDVEGMQPDLPQ